MVQLLSTPGVALCCSIRIRHRFLVIRRDKSTALPNKIEIFIPSFVLLLVLNVKLKTDKMQSRSVTEDSTHSSPLSESNESHYGTPGTKLTEFSPEDGRNDQTQLPCRTVQTPQPPAFVLKPNLSPANPYTRSEPSDEPDPFTSTEQLEHNKPGQKLSATAASFRPLALASSPHAKDTLGLRNVSATTWRESSGTPIVASSCYSFSHQSGTDEPKNISSSPLTDALPNDSRNPSKRSNTALPPTQDMSAAPLKHGFPGDSGTRYMQITGVDKIVGVDNLNRALKVWRSS